jgi:alpha-mannosidase
LKPIIAFLILFAAPVLGEPAVRIVSAEPSALFPRQTPLRQIAYVTILNEQDRDISCELTARVAGGDTGPATTVKATPGTSRQRVLVPDIQAAADVEFTLREAGHVDTAHFTAHWQPQRKWKIYIVKSSHEDLGYENYIFMKQHDIANYIDLAANISRASENVTELERKSDAKYHYTMETLLFERNYIEERGERAWRGVVEKDVKTGAMNLMGAPSGVHSHWMDYEELARMTYPARRDAKDRFGLDLKTFMIVDNPSLSWAGAQALAGAGFKYVARWGQGWRTGGHNDYRTTKLPALFWWEAPDGLHRVLFGWRSHYDMPLWYGQTGGGSAVLVDMASDKLSGDLKQIEAGSLGPYPYDALINPEYVDHDIPRFDTRVLPAWAEKYAYPDIRIGNPDHFFEYIESRYGDQLPVLRGDLNNFSADYATIDPEAQGWKRDAARLVPIAEGLGALSGAMNPGYLLSPSLVDRTYMRMWDFDEHSWPTQPLASDVQLFNAAWVKKEEARRVIGAAEAQVAETSSELAKQIQTGPGDTLAVFNSLVHPRTEVVRTKGDFVSLTDLSTGRPVACQRTDGGMVVFLASDVPAFGYKLYRIERTHPAALESGNFEIGADSFANQYYRIRFDSTGAIRSIVDKESGRELVDPKAPYLANQMVYVHKNARESKAGFESSPKKALKMDGSKGPVQAEFTVWIDDDKTQAAIRQTVVLYSGVKRIDFINRLEHARALYSKNYEDRYEDNIFYAFPFAVEGGQPRVEYAGGVVRPYIDQLRWGSHDYLHANRWVDVSNSEQGVTMVPWNEATFEFGDIRYNQFSIDYQPTKPWLFSYAWSNRMAGLLTLNGDDCNATLGYSMTSHNGDWDSGATTRFAWSAATPMIVFPVATNHHGALSGASRGFLSADASNVQLTVMKNTEQPGRGWVVRFVETQGKATEFTLDAAALHVERAHECDLVENDLQALKVNVGKVRVSIRAFGMATVKLERGSAPGEVSGLAAKSMGDEAVALTWNATTGAAAYNVYRSDDPDAPPTAQDLIGRITSTSFTDHGLHIKTSYFYRVAAVSESNLQGPVSARVDAIPDGPNVTTPVPVSELGVIRRATDRLMVYWRSNSEPDVARYRVYRGETPDFSLKEPVVTIEPAPYFLQLFLDQGLQPGKTYYYKVLAEDWAGNRQKISPVASATTPAY